jgi:hypothetical protein
MKRISRGQALPTGPTIAAIVVAMGCIWANSPANAAVDFSAGASYGIQHDTNALALASFESAQPPSTGGNASKSDTSRQISANLSAAAGIGSLSTGLTGSATRSEYDRYDAQSRTDYNLSGTLGWAPIRAFDMSLQASQSRTPVTQADVGGDRTVLQTSTQAQVTFRLRPTPRWQLGLTPPAWREEKTPLQTAKDFQLRERTYGATLDFLGAGKLIPGLAATESRSKNSNIANATRYRQQNFQGTLSYSATGYSKFAFGAGYSRRTTHLVEPSTDPAALELEGRQGAFTGNISYFRQLSPKTSATVSAFRSVQQYAAGVNTSLVTGFSGGINWAPTRKISTSFDTSFVWASVDALPVAGTTVQRKDLARSFAFTISYLATRHFGMRASIARRMRNSTVWADQYNGETFGLDITARID